MRAIAIVLLLSLAATGPAHAQMWGLQQPGAHLGDMGIVSYQSRDWAQCAGDEQVSPQRAISACGRIIGERYSRNHTAAGYAYRARLHREAGNVEQADADEREALRLFRNVVASEPNDAIAINNLASLRYRTGDYDGALTDYARAIELGFDRAIGRVRRGQIFFIRGDYAAAAAEFDAAATFDPDNANYQAARCETRAAARIEPQLAAAACENALRLSGGSSDAFFSRGFMRYLAGDLAGAFSDFTASLRADGTNPFAHYGYGVVGIKMGHESEGQAIMARAREVDEDVALYIDAGLRP